MALPDIRHRAGVFFLAAIVGNIVLISTQVNSRHGVPLLEVATFGVFAEVQRAISTAISGVRAGWGGYVGLKNVRLENESLKHQLADAQVELQQQRALADRSRGLERLLGLREQASLATVAAEIIASGATPDFRTVTIDRGSSDGVKADMAVIAPGGVIGRTVVASLRAAKVQLLIDRNAAAGAIIERSRAQGVVVGAGDERLHMEYVSEAADIVTGDVLVTSGIDGIYPKGFLLGQIETVEKNGPSYKRIIVKPAVDFRTVEEVLVVTAPVKEHGGDKE